MADMVIDTSALTTKSSTLKSLSDKANDIYTSFGKSAIAKAPSPISGLKTIVDTPLKRYKDGFKNAYDWFIEYISGIEKIDGNLSKYEGQNVTTPTSFNAKFEDLFGKVTIPTIQSSGDTTSKYNTASNTTNTSNNNSQETSNTQSYSNNKSSSKKKKKKKKSSSSSTYGTTTSSTTTNNNDSTTSTNNSNTSTNTTTNTSTTTTTSTTTINTNTATTTTNINVGDLDMTNYPKGKSKEDGIKRAILVAKYLMKNGGFTAIQAAAIVGVFIDENNCDPGEVMEAEKNGKGASGTGGNGYGAGIGSWTFESTKKQALKDAGFSENTKIESLTLQQQCDMVIATSQKSQKRYYDALKRCTTIEDASATAVCITGGVGFSKNWSTHPTPAEAKALADHYGSSNDKRFGKSTYHWNLDKRRLNYAKQVLPQLTTQTTT